MRPASTIDPAEDVKLGQAVRHAADELRRTIEAARKVGLAVSIRLIHDGMEAHRIECSRLRGIKPEVTRAYDCAEMNP